jgi:hypothetical protein
VSTDMSVYKAGVSRNGWCCTGCHHERAFEHNGKPRRVWLHLRIHRAVRHARFGRPKYTGLICSISHTTGAEGSWQVTKSGLSTTYYLTFTSSGRWGGAA